MVIIGTGVVAMLQLLASGTMSNDNATEMTTAINLAANLHETMVGLPFTNATYPTSTTYKDPGGPTAYSYLWAFNGDTYSPPLDIRRVAISACTGWSQQVTIQSVDPTNLTTVRPNSTTLPNARVTVTVLHGSKIVLQTSWLMSASS